VSHGVYQMAVPHRI